MFELKKCTEELCLMALKIDAKFEGKLTFALKNDMRNLPFFPFQFGQEQNISGNSIERRVY